MTNAFRSAWAVLIWLFVLIIPIQFYLAGRGAFGYHEATKSARSDAWGAHAAVGSILALIIILTLITAFAGRLPASLLKLEGALFVSMFVQMILPAFGDDASTRWIAALHPVNALILAGLGIMLAVRSRQYLPIARFRSESVAT